MGRRRNKEIRYGSGDGEREQWKVFTNGSGKILKSRNTGMIFNLLTSAVVKAVSFSSVSVNWSTVLHVKHERNRLLRRI